MPSGDKLTKALKLNFNNDDAALTNQQTLRRTVGVLGILLPVLLYIYLGIAAGYSNVLESISHYYYTRTNGIFIIIISMLAVFLLIYKGKEPIDFYVSSIAGIFALSVIMFPTNAITTCCDADKAYSMAYIKDHPTRIVFHFVSAGIFLSCLSFMSLFLFTRSDKTAAERTPKKRSRNKLYRITGVIMLLAMLVIFAGYIKIIPPDFYDRNHLTFWMESLAVWSFGVSWLVKGEMIMKD